MRTLNNNSKKARTNPEEYYKGNIGRIDYELYRCQGLVIGSVPVEEAHRTAIQTRMKRNEQRWVPKRSQATAQYKGCQKK